MDRIFVNCVAVKSVAVNEEIILTIPCVARKQKMMIPLLLWSLRSFSLPEVMVMMMIILLLSSFPMNKLTAMTGACNNSIQYRQITTTTIRYCTTD